MTQQLGLEGQERIFKVDIALTDLNLFELNVLTRYPERPYLIPLLRERDAAAALVFSLQSHLTLEQWLPRHAENYHDVLSILEEIVNILDRSPEHCLRLDQFSLEPSRICFNTVEKRVELIYLPVRQSSTAFEKQWGLLIAYLEIYGAKRLKPEGSELFKSLSSSTVGRYERQNACLKVIRRWFGTGLDQFDALKTASAAQEPRSTGLDYPNASVFEKGRSVEFETVVHIADHATGGTADLIKHPKGTTKWNFSGGMFDFFKHMNKGKEKKTGYNNENTKSSLRQEAIEIIQTGAGFQQNSIKYRPEFEGTTLLSEQEKLQGKLILQNQQACRIFELSKPITRLGRNTSLCDVVIEDDITIGRLHAEVHRIDLGYFVKDLDSLNGTFLNDQRLDSQTMYKLKGNDRLRLSELEIIFV